MDQRNAEVSRRVRIIEDLDVSSVAEIVARELAEFTELVEDKQLDGRKLLSITEGIVKLWRPKANARKLINFIENLKNNPQIFIKHCDGKNLINAMTRGASFNGTSSAKEICTIDSKMVFEGTSMMTLKESRVRKISKSQHLEFNSESIERIFCYEPPKSFLYRGNLKNITRTKDSNFTKEKINSSYVPMDVGTNVRNNERKNIASKINDYIHFDLNKINVFSNRNEKKFDDRGYYALNKVADSYDDVGYVDFGKIKKSDKVNFDDHFYEDLNMHPYQEIETGNLKRNSFKKDFNALSKSPCMLRLNEIFSTFKFPIHHKTLNNSNTSEIDNSKASSAVDDKESCFAPKDVKSDKLQSKKEKINHIYENNESSSGLYDSIETGLNEIKTESAGRFQASKVPVEEYLEPINLNKEYADVVVKEKDSDSIVSFVRKLFENGFGIHKECDKPPEPPAEQLKPPISKIEFSEPPDRPLETLQKWNENLRANHKPDVKTKMADRPLPVPVENEFYYMDVDRLEASKLLEGHADGTFILRPSSQPFHAYTISLVYRGQVHNVGVRRREDGRLALGFSKRQEQSFATITELIEHHYREKMLLIVDGQKIGSTQLRRLHG